MAIPRKKRRKLIIFLKGLIGLGIDAIVAEAIKIFDAADDDDSAWPEQLKFLSIAVEGVHADAFDNELTSGEISAHGQTIQDSLDAL